MQSVGDFFGSAFGGRDRPGKAQSALDLENPGDTRVSSGARGLQPTQIQASDPVEFQRSEWSILQRGRQIFVQELSMSSGMKEHFAELQQSIARPKASPYQPQAVFEPPSPEDVANTVLGFVEGRLKAEAASGASEEKFGLLLDQARKGVETGYAQAREQIEALSMMSEELSGEIDQSFSLVNTGLDELRGKYVPADQSSARFIADKEKVMQGDESDDASDPVSTEGRARSDEARTGGAYRAGYSELTGYHEHLGINVRTRDGDNVTVFFSEVGASLKSGDFRLSGDANDYSGFQSWQGLAYESKYSIRVDGDLDEGELQALNELFARTDALAEQFFSGNLDEAFESALDLGIDTSELASFSLSMTQTQVRQVSAYESFASISPSGHEGRLSGAFEGLRTLAERTREAVESARLFAQPIQLVSDTFDQLFESGIRSREGTGQDLSSNERRFQDLVHQMLEQL
ncbi:MAG: hypothetical protein CSA52_03690 [Gammaproteobacteria bacterium]|nr:MAG: hypothetical protein CSB48_06095 [Pseudomonadota bacterium]PIE38125.1 MAG: hypothetical protein CSA52_03690 [Gammaproteobacteria bacterium]